MKILIILPLIRDCIWSKWKETLHQIETNNLKSGQKQRNYNITVEWPLPLHTLIWDTNDKKNEFLRIDVSTSIIYLTTFFIDIRSLITCHFASVTEDSCILQARSYILILRIRSIWLVNTTEYCGTCGSWTIPSEQIFFWFLFLSIGLLVWRMGKKVLHENFSSLSLNHREKNIDRGS